MKRTIILIAVFMFLFVITASAEDSFEPDPIACGWFENSGFSLMSTATSEMDSCVMYFLGQDAYSVVYGNTIVQYDNGFTSPSDLRLMSDLASLAEWIEDPVIGPSLTLIGAPDEKTWVNVVVVVTLSNGGWIFTYDVSGGSWSEATQ